MSIIKKISKNLKHFLKNHIGILNSHKKYNVKNKLIYIFGVFISFVAIAFIIGVLNFYSFLNREFIANNVEIVEQVSRNIENSFLKLELSKEQAIINFCGTRLYNKEKLSREDIYYGGTETLKSLNHIAKNNKDIKNFYIFNLPNSTVYSAYGLNSYTPIKEQMQDYCSMRIGQMHYEFSENGVRLVEALGNYNKEVTAILRIDYDFAVIKNILENIKFDVSLKGIYFICEQNDFYFNVKNHSLAESDEIEAINKALELEEEVACKIDVLRDNVFIKRDIKNVGCTIAVEFSYFELFFSLFKSYNFPLIILTATIFILIIISWVETQKISYPIQVLTKKMRQFSSTNNMKISMEELRTENEDVIIMAETFNLMLDKVEKLNIENMQKELLRAEANYNMRLAQINPHFIFNSLENLRGLALKEKNYTLSECLFALSQMLRYSLSIEKGEVVLQDELDNLNNYMTLNDERFETPIEVQYYIDEKTLKAPVVKLLLQPIVENSIKYGFRNRKGKNIIRITSQRVENGLTIDIYDNGSGIREDCVKSLNSLLQGKDIYQQDVSNGFGIGLKNISERLQYVFGENSSITVQSEEGKYTRILVNIVYDG